MATWRTHKERGNGMFREGKYEDADDAYTCAIDAAMASGQPTSEDLGALHSNRAAARLKLGRQQEALEAAKSCISCRPRWAKGYYRAAQSLLALQRPAEAAAFLRAAAQQCGADAEIAALQKQAEACLAGQPNGRELSAEAPSGVQPALDPAAIPDALRHQYVYQASHDGVNSNLLLLLHGLGDTSRPYARLAKQMALPQTAALALCGPLEVPHADGGRAWFPAFNEHGELLQADIASAVRAAGLDAAVARLQQLLQGLRRCGWPPARLHLFGFSQGGTVALELARRQRGPDKLGGCAVVAACLLPEHLEAGGTGLAAASGQAAAKGAGTPVVMVHGAADNVVPLELAHRTRRALAAGGSAAEVHVVAGKGHSMLGGPSEVRPLMAFWGRTLSSSPVGADVLELRP